MCYVCPIVQPAQGNLWKWCQKWITADVKSSVFMISDSRIWDTWTRSQDLRRASRSSKKWSLMILEWFWEDLRILFFPENPSTMTSLFMRCPSYTVSFACQIPTKSWYSESLCRCQHICPLPSLESICGPTPWGSKLLDYPARGWGRCSILDPSETKKKEEGECFAHIYVMCVPLCSQHKEICENGIKSGSQLTLNRLFLRISDARIQDTWSCLLYTSDAADE